MAATIGIETPVRVETMQMRATQALAGKRRESATRVRGFAPELIALRTG